MQAEVVLKRLLLAQEVLNVNFDNCPNLMVPGLAKPPVPWSSKLDAS